MMSKITNQKRRPLLLLAGLLLAVIPATAFAQIGTTAASFLTIGVGARPMGMGGAFVAVSDDANALYWNPAGLGMMQQSEIVLQHSTYLAGMTYEFVGGAIAMGLNGTVGFSATMLNVGEMEVTTEDYQEGTGLMFDSYSMAAAFSYSYRFYDRFSIGANLKYIRETIWNESADGVALDIGTMLITPFKGIRLGMNISNFGTKMQMAGRDLLFLYDPDDEIEGNNPDNPASYETDAWKLPLTLRLGLSGELVENSVNRITLAMDWVVPNDNTESLNVGMEYAFREMFMIRGGLKGIRPGSYDGSYQLTEPDNNGGYTFGAGFSFNLTGFILKTDYGFETYERLGGTHKYSLSLVF